MLSSATSGDRTARGPAMKALGFALTLAALAVVWVVAGLFIAERRAFWIGGSASVLDSATAAFREHAVQTFDAAELALKHVGETLEYIAPEELDSPARLTRLLARLQQASPFFEVIGLVGLDGHVIDDSRGGARGRDVSDRPYVKAIFDDPARTFYLGRAFRTRASGLISIPVSAPWHGADGRLKGVITGLIDPEYFSKFYAHALFGRHLSVALTIPGGGPIAEYPDNIARRTARAELPVPAVGRSGVSRATRMHSTVDGREFLVAAASDNEPPIVVAVGEPFALIDARWRRTAWVVGGFAAALSVVIVIAAALFRRKRRLDEALNASVRRIAEEQMHLADSKFRFLAQVSHELRTPLNAVIGFSGMIGGEKLGPIGNPRYREYARDIEQSGRYLLGVVNDLLDFAKLDAGKFVLREAEFPVVEAIETVRVLLAPLAAKAGIALAVDDLAPGVRLCGDLQIVKQMLVNIVGNAIKFTPEGGAVTLTVRRAENGTLLFRVADNGVGIPKEDIPRILKPFEQSNASGANGSSLRRERDTGLGLALTSKFAGLHDARIDIDSAVGVGTAVTVTFPRGRVRMPEPGQPAEGAAA